MRSITMEKIGMVAIVLFLAALGYVMISNYIAVVDSCNDGFVAVDAANQYRCVSNPVPVINVNGRR